MTHNDNIEAQRICDKWADKLGYGFHPDTRGADYDPPLSANEVNDYNADMSRLFSLNIDDPYEFGVAALKKLG